MAPIESGGINVNSPKGIRHHHHHVLKKGPWTTSEDMILVEYVKKHGEGNWNAVQRNSGLMRGGKSCRLRWANHLRPNLKKGAFTPEEENIIVQLHAKMGNKWARMAAQLPGRTDNEIKNYWNTRLKRRQRAGLPIYPREIRQEQQQHHHQFSTNSPPQSSLSPLIVSSNAPNPNPLRFFNAFASPSPSPNSHHFINQSLASFYGNSSSSNLNLLPMPSLLQYSSSGAEISMLGLPSIQSMPAVSVQDRTITPVESCNDFVMATTPSDGGCAEDYEMMATQCNKSGLLEDLLGEPHQKLTCCPDMTDHESFIAAVGEEDDEHQQTQSGFGFGHDGDSQANNHGYDQSKETNVDEDLLNLLDSFPLSVPIPDWNEEHGDVSRNPMNKGTTTDEIESQVNVIPEYNTATATHYSSSANQEWNFGSCFWNNMPSIY